MPAAEAPIIHCLQHAERVQPTTVAAWARARGAELRIVRVDLEPLPDPSTVTRLVVLGGAMNTDEADQHPWMAPECELLETLIERGGCDLLGICLGSQLIAHVLGGAVGRAEVPEIGWQRVELTDAGRASAAFGGLPPQLDVMEWHGDAWSLPPGAELTVTGSGCATQAFSWGDRVHGVQFHPEFSFARMQQLIATTPDDLTRGGCIQTGEQILQSEERFSQLERHCMTLLDGVFSDVAATSSHT